MAASNLKLVAVASVESFMTDFKIKHFIFGVTSEFNTFNTSSCKQSEVLGKSDAGSCHGAGHGR